MEQLKELLSKIKYWLMHRFHPKHQYNRIRIKSLSPGYYDPDIRMLHACFDLYTEWFRYNVFEEKLMDRSTVDEGNPGLWDEMMALYLWWTVKKPEFEVDNTTTLADMEAMEEQEDEMLMRLMKIRRHIWYL